MDELTDAIVEVKRELVVRKTVYPRLVFAGKLTQFEADRREAALGWAVAYLLKLKRNWEAVCKLDNEADPTPETITD